MEDKPLDDRLKNALRRTDPAPPFPEQQIRARIRETIEHRVRHRPTARRGSIRVAAVAASIFLFLAGALFGRWTAESRVVSPVPTAALPVQIQAEGTDYVAAVTRFAELAESLTPQEREQARQVALAVLHGAALELLRYAPNDGVAETVFESVSEQRYDGGRRDDEIEVISF